MMKYRHYKLSHSYDAFKDQDKQNFDKCFADQEENQSFEFQIGESVWKPVNSGYQLTDWYTSTNSITISHLSN